MGGFIRLRPVFYRMAVSVQSYKRGAHAVKAHTVRAHIRSAPKTHAPPAAKRAPVKQKAPAKKAPAKKAPAVKKAPVKKAPAKKKETAHKTPLKFIPRNKRTPALYPPAFTYNHKKIRCSWNGKGQITFETNEYLEGIFYRDIDYQDLSHPLTQEKVKEYCRNQILYNPEWVTMAKNRGPLPKKTPAPKKAAPKKAAPKKAAPKKAPAKPKGPDTGADPLGDGNFKMYPSGDIVDFAERCRRLPSKGMTNAAEPLIFGYTWEQIKNKQQKKGW